MHQGRLSTDPTGLAVTYVVAKPAAAWILPFYWDDVFGVSGYWVLRIHALMAVLGIALLAYYSVRSRSRPEFMLLFLNVIVITGGASYYLGLSRYVYPYMPFVYVSSRTCSLPWAHVSKGQSQLHATDSARRPRVDAYP